MQNHRNNQGFCFVFVCLVFTTPFHFIGLQRNFHQSFIEQQLPGLSWWVAWVAWSFSKNLVGQNLRIPRLHGRCPCRSVPAIPAVLVAFRSHVWVKSFTRKSFKKICRVMALDIHQHFGWRCTSSLSQLVKQTLELSKRLRQFSVGKIGQKQWRWMVHG